MTSLREPWELDPQGWMDRWIESHSVNCIKCSVLFDEREGITPDDGEGTICPACLKDG